MGHTDEGTPDGDCPPAFLLARQRFRKVAGVPVHVSGAAGLCGQNGRRPIATLTVTNGVGELRGKSIRLCGIRERPTTQLQTHGGGSFPEAGPAERTGFTLTAHKRQRQSPPTKPIAQYTVVGTAHPRSPSRYRDGVSGGQTVDVVRARDAARADGMGPRNLRLHAHSPAVRVATRTGPRC